MLTGTLILQIIATTCSLFMVILTILGAINWTRKNKKNVKTNKINELKYQISFIEKEITDLRNKPIDSNDTVLANLISKQVETREKQVVDLKKQLEKLEK